MLKKNIIRIDEHFCYRERLPESKKTWFIRKKIYVFFLKELVDTDSLYFGEYVPYIFYNKLSQCKKIIKSLNRYKNMKFKIIKMNKISYFNMVYFYGKKYNGI